MLPHFVWADFRDVLDELSSRLRIRAGVVRPALEFRFPRFGAVIYDNVALELRKAIEPWHVLGEEGGRRHGALCRFVGRAAAGQATGINEGRHVVTCNGRRVPMTGTGGAGELVAGVRFRPGSRPRRCIRRSPCMRR